MLFEGSGKSEHYTRLSSAGSNLNRLHRSLRLVQNRVHRFEQLIRTRAFYLVGHHNRFQVEVSLEVTEQLQRNQDYDGCEDRQQVFARTRSHPDGSDHKDRGGSGQSGYRTTLAQDGACAQESHALDDV